MFSHIFFQRRSFFLFVFTFYQKFQSIPFSDIQAHDIEDQPRVPLSCSVADRHFSSAPDRLFYKLSGAFDIQSVFKTGHDLKSNHCQPPNAIPGLYLLFSAARNILSTFSRPVRMPKLQKIENAIPATMITTPVTPTAIG